MLAIGLPYSAADTGDRITRVDEHRGQIAANVTRSANDNRTHFPDILSPVLGGAYTGPIRRAAAQLDASNSRTYDTVPSGKTYSSCPSHSRATKSIRLEDCGMKALASRALLRRVSDRDMLLHRESLVRRGLLKLLAIKDSDIRILTLE